MRILHAIASLAPRYGGPSIACPALCRELARQGHQVAIYTTNVDGHQQSSVSLNQPVFDNGVELRFFSGWTHPLEYKFSPSLRRALADRIPAVDLVHIYSLYIFSATAAAHLCRRFKVPYLLHPHGSLDPFLLRRHPIRKWLYSALIERRNFRHASAVLFNSQEELRLAEPWLDRVLPAPTRRRPALEVVPVGLEEECFTPVSAGSRQQFLSRYPELIGKHILLFFGRLSFKKGLDLLAEAFIELARDSNRVHLLVVGPDTEGYGEKLRHWLGAGRVLERATFTGPLEGVERFVALQSADVFALPSYSENFGQSVAEAMASGVPVVISNKVNIWPSIEITGAGLVVPCEARALARALSTLFDDRSRAREMGERGRRWAAETLRWTMVGPQMADLYQRILDCSQSERSAGAPSVPGASQRYSGLMA